MNKFKYTPSFYVSQNLLEPLTWKEHLHNGASELIHFPLIHKHYNQVDTKTFENRRISQKINRGKLLELIFKIVLAATIVIPLVSLAIAYLTESKRLMIKPSKKPLSIFEIKD